MGASSLILPGQRDSAMAAEPETASSHTTFSPSASSGVGVPQVDAIESLVDLAPSETRQSDRASSPKIGSVSKVDLRKSISKTQTLKDFDASAPLSNRSDSINRPLKVFPSGSAIAPIHSPSVKRVPANQIAPHSEFSPNTRLGAAETLPDGDLTAPSLAPEMSAPAATSGSVHQVAQGETLYSIARQYGVSEDELEAINPLDDPTFLKIGQSIALPSGVKRITPAVLSVFGTQLASSPKAVKASEPKVAILEATEEDADVARSISPSSEETPLILAEGETESPTPEVVPTAPAPQISWAGNNETEDAAQRLASKLKPHTETANNAYVEELRSEVSQLRAKSRVRREEANVAATIPSPLEESATASEETELTESVRQVNPEFNPEQHAAALQSAGLKPWAQPHALAGEELQSDENSTADETTVAIAESTEATDKDPEVSVAPLGAANYAPIRTPQLVSPELPALQSPQAYLPKPSSGGYNEKLEGYIWPARGALTSGYGWRWGRMHKGIDIAADVGTPIVAAAAGVVTYASWNDGGYGNLVEITHVDGSITLYAHNDRILVSEGQQVEQGEQVAEMGSTGFSTGPHLHFEVHPPGQGAIDPMALLPQ